MKTTAQRRFVNLTEFRFSDDTGAGELTGYTVRYNDLNDYGEINLPGAYDECLPAFLQSGFSTDSHDWTWRGTVGFVKDARSDSNGLLITVAFHGTEDAQSVRAKVRERMEAGKSVGLSEGFIAQDYFAIYPNQYESELPKYLRKDRLSELMAYARQFPRIIVIRKAQILEASIVTAPSQANANVTSVRSVQTRGDFLGEYAEGNMMWSAVQALMDSFTWSVLWDCCFNGTMSAEDACTQIDGAMKEMSDLMQKTCMALMADDPDEMDMEARHALADKVADSITKFLGSRGSLRFNQHSDIARAAVAGLLTRALSLNDVKKREGKTLSKKTRDALEGLHGDMQTCCTQIRDLLDSTDMAEERGGNQLTELRKRDLLSRLAAHGVN